jgi:hypothetical protein
MEEIDLHEACERLRTVLAETERSGNLRQGLQDADRALLDLGIALSQVAAGGARLAAFTRLRSAVNRGRNCPTVTPLRVGRWVSRTRDALDAFEGLGQRQASAG